VKRCSEHKQIRIEEIPCQEISNPAVLSKNPLVSVKMLTYNHEQYIPQAIEGVLIQKTDFPIELIVGEDRSTDYTREIVLKHQKKYPEIIRVITSEKNVGAWRNSLRTGNACRGKYIAFCEGDDYWTDPYKLQKQVDYLEKHPECGLVHSDVDRYYVKEGIKIKSYHKNRMIPNNNGESILKAIILYDYIVETCTAVVRKDLLNEIHKTCHFEFSENFLMGDIQTWTEIAYRSKIKYMNEVLATRNLLAESACRSSDIDRQIRFLRNSRAIHLHYANKYGGVHSTDLEKSIIDRVDRELINLACRIRKPELARELLVNLKKYQIPLDKVSYFHLIGSQKAVTFYLVKFLVLPIRVSRKIIRVLCSLLESKF